MRCDCGQERVLSFSAFLSGTTQSCGCLLREKITKHGGYKDPVYAVWAAMRARCTSHSDPSWADYGGRGISVAERWQDYSTFVADMGPRPDGGTLDRVDVNGGYCVENCRWATQRQQANNRRNNQRVTYDGVTRTISEWAVFTGIGRSCLNYRLAAGWPPKLALTSAPDRRRQHRV
jgi:hypothetical protein